MKKLRRIKNSLSLILATTMLATLFTGCGKSKETDESSILNEATNASKDYVFRTEDFNVDGVDGDNVRTIKYVHGKVYANDYGYNGHMNFWSFNTDGKEVINWSITTTDNDSIQYTDYDSEGNVYLIHEIYQFADEPIDDGYAGANYSDTADEYPCYLEKYDQSGNMVYRVDLKKEILKDNEDYLLINSMDYSDVHGVVFSSNHGIYTYSEDAGIDVVIDYEKDTKYSSTSLIVTESAKGDFYVTGYGDSLEFICAPLDIDNKQIGEESTASFTDSSMSVFAGEGYDLYFSTNKDVYGYDHEKDALVKLFDYQDSDLGLSYPIFCITAVSDAEMIAVIPTMNVSVLSKLYKVPADQVADKTVITLGGTNIDYLVKREITDFNKNNTEYRIKIVDYSTYNANGNYGEADNRFNLDIASGNVPDIMVFTADQPIEGYINKGLFKELGSFVDKDEELSKDMFLENVMEAFSTGEDLYTIVPSFYIYGAEAKTSLLNGKDYLTIREFEDIVSQNNLSYELSFGTMNRQEVLEKGINFYGSDFIDWENKTCNFNGDEFIEFLEFVGHFPETISDDVWMKDIDAIYRKDEAVLRFSNLNCFELYKEERYGVFGEDITFAGFPSVFDENCSAIYPVQKVTISSSCKNPEGAWEFVRTLLTEGFQDKISYQLPVRKSSLDKMAKEATKVKYTTDENGNQVEEINYYYMDGEPVALPTLSEDDVNKVMEYIGSVDKPYVFNNNVLNIITEEASAYFSGQKSVQEVADIIQSRISIYVKETS